MNDRKCRRYQDFVDSTVNNALYPVQAHVIV